MTALAELAEGMTKLAILRGDADDTPLQLGVVKVVEALQAALTIEVTLIGELLDNLKRIDNDNASN